MPNEEVPAFLKPYWVERVAMEATTSIAPLYRRLARAETAHVHFRFDSPVTRAYHRIAERRGKGKAKVAAARMLLLVCRSVLVNRRPYFNLVHGQA